MSKQAFKVVNLRAASLETVALCNQIIARYQAQNLRLTLRQLYYQLVTRNAIKNEERSYKNLGSLISDARLAGLVDWDAIEDRIRRPVMWAEYDNLADFVRLMEYRYRLPRWRDQPHYVELWVEKDALAGVLQPHAGEYHVTMMVNRGYSSQSAMYDAFKRFKTEAERRDKLVLLYLGDHDPSGEDMVRDIRDRLEMFLGADADLLSVKKVALTREQVEQYNPPPNPAKTTDSRYEGYAAIHGNTSWEVDALPPDVLTQIIRDEIQAERDPVLTRRVLHAESQDRAALRKAAEEIAKASGDGDSGLEEDEEGEE